MMYSPCPDPYFLKFSIYKQENIGFHLNNISITVWIRNPKEYTSPGEFHESESLRKYTSV